MPRKKPVIIKFYMPAWWFGDSDQAKMIRDLNWRFRENYRHNKKLPSKNSLNPKIIALSKRISDTFENDPMARVVIIVFGGATEDKVGTFHEDRFARLCVADTASILAKSPLPNYDISGTIKSDFICNGRRNYKKYGISTKYGATKLQAILEETAPSSSH